MLAVWYIMGLSLRGWGAAAVLLAWGGSLGWLALRHYGGSEADRVASAASLGLAPGDSWFSVMAGDQQVGYVGITLDTLSPGYRLTELGALAVPLDDGIALASRAVRHDLSANLSLRSGTTAISFDGFRSHDSVLVQGGTISYLRNAGERGEIAHGSDPGLPVLAIPYRLAATGALSAGLERRMAVLDGSPPISTTVALHGVGDSLMIVADSAVLDPATGIWREVGFDTLQTRLLSVRAPAGPVHIRVGPRGALAGLRYPLGVSWVRTDFGIAMTAFRRDMAAMEAAIAGALPRVQPLAGSGLPADTTTAVTVYRIVRPDGGAVPLGDLRMFDDGRQHLGRDSLMRIHPRGRPEEPSRPPMKDPLAQSDDSAVVALASELRSRIEARDWDAVAAAVRARVELDHSPEAAAGAAETLRRRRGSPDGIARLFAAVLGAGGVPARQVVGVLPGDGVFHTHSWVEIRMPREREWISADPVYGRGTAGTGLFRIGIGGSSRPDQLLPMIANARFIRVDDAPAEDIGK